MFAAVFVFAVLDGAGGLVAPLFRRIISGLIPDARQGEVLAAFASIETVCQLSAGVIYNGLFELTSGFFPQAFGLLAAASTLAARLAHASSSQPTRRMKPMRGAGRATTRQLGRELAT